MRENFLHFMSDVPSMVTINGCHIGVVDNTNNQEIDLITKTNRIFVSYNPISDSQYAIPYTFSLNTETIPTSENEYIKVVPFPNNHYDIIMKPFYYYQVAQPNVLFNKSVGKYFVSIVSDNVCRITIFSSGTIVFNINIAPLISVLVKNINNLIIIEGVVDNDDYYLLIINSENFEILFNDIVQSIELDEAQISSYQTQNTLCNHAKVTSINLANKAKDSYFVYANTQDVYQIHSMLIPQAFLECVKVSDENKARSYLGKNLASTNMTQLKNYFGNISSIYFNRHNSTHKLNYTIESDKMKNYNFIMDNNQIIDIEENFQI